MKYKLLLLLMFAALSCFGQNSYTYENLTVTAKSDNGAVRWDGMDFELRDSIVEISVSMSGRAVGYVTIRNLTQRPIIARWRKFFATNMYYVYKLVESDPKKYKKYTYDYYDANVDPSVSISDTRSGEETIYVDGYENFYFTYSPNDMFPEKLSKAEGVVYLPLVVDGREVIYWIKLTGVNAK